MKWFIFMLSNVVLWGCSGPVEQQDMSQDPDTTDGTSGATQTSEVHYAQETHLSNIRQLTAGGDNAEAYFNSTDDRVVCQITNEDWDVACDQIFLLDLDTEYDRESQPTRISNGKGRTTCSYFLPGDTTIVFASTHLADEACPDKPEKREDGKYVWPVYESYDLFVADLEGNIIAQLTDNPGYDAEATVSPKGDRIVFTSTRSGDLELWTMKVDGSELTQITNELGYDGGAFFSPDGQQLIFRSSRPTTEEDIAIYKDLLAEGLVMPTDMELFICNADGSELRQLTDLGGANWCPFFHPDGNRIIFSSNHATEKGFPFNLYMINVEDSELTQITWDGVFDAFPMFSNNGKKLIFSSNRNNGGTRSTNLFIADWKDNATTLSESEDNNEDESGSGVTNWIKGLGIGAFLFFLVKGLIWLGVFFGLGKVIKRWIKRNKTPIA